MSELVERLSQGWHPIEISIRPEKNVDAFKERLERGYVHVLFTGTRGGTELGIAIDRDASDCNDTALANAQGTVTLVGPLTLDYVKVRCVAKVELPSLQGVGRLERAAEPSN